MSRKVLRRGECTLFCDVATNTLALVPHYHPSYSLEVVTDALDLLTPDPVEEIDQVLYIETIYDNLKRADDW